MPVDLLKKFDALSREEKLEAAKRLEMLFRSGEAQERLRVKTDREIAQLVQEHLWAHEDIVSMRSTLLEDVIMRLRRSEAGALPEIKDDE